MIAITDHHTVPSPTTRHDAQGGHRVSWRRAVEVLWIVLNAPAMIEGGLGSLDAGVLSQDDRRLRALSRRTS
jgi:hypothetical protein